MRTETTRRAVPPVWRYALIVAAPAAVAISLWVRTPEAPLPREHAPTDGIGGPQTATLASVAGPGATRIDDHRMRLGRPSPGQSKRTEATPPRTIPLNAPHRPEVTTQGGRAADGAIRFAGALPRSAEDDPGLFEVLDALGPLDEPAVPLLGQVLFGEPDSDRRRRAVEMLASIDSPAATTLLESATEDTDAYVREEARDALAARDHPSEAPVAQPDEAPLAAYSEFAEAADTLLAELAWIHQPEERVAAIRRLYAPGEDPAVEILKIVLKRDAELSVREEALRVLDYLGDEAAAQAMQVALGDPSPSLRRKALASLWSLDASNLLPAVGQVLYGDPDPGLRLEAVRLLGNSDSPAAQALLESALDDSDARVRGLARQFLGP